MLTALSFLPFLPQPRPALPPSLLNERHPPPFSSFFPPGTLPPLFPYSIVDWAPVTGLRTLPHRTVFLFSFFFFPRNVLIVYYSLDLL